MSAAVVQRLACMPSSRGESGAADLPPSVSSVTIVKYVRVCICMCVCVLSRVRRERSMREKEEGRVEGRKAGRD